MNEWTRSIQKMIDWIEGNIRDNPTLLDMSKQIGYSPYYCSTKFHEIVGMTIKSYISGRRLAIATLEIRDTKTRILDIALHCGYSSQEALTRAFSSAYGCTPAEYRRKPRPVALSIRQVVLEMCVFDIGDLCNLFGCQCNRYRNISPKIMNRLGRTCRALLRKVNICK